MFVLDYINFSERRQKSGHMSYEINRENGIANRGNWSRLKKLMQRAKAGESLTLGFLGGSITQGCLASRPNLCYAYRVYSWW